MKPAHLRAPDEQAFARIARNRRKARPLSEPMQGLCAAYEAVVEAEGHTAAALRALSLAGVSMRKANPINTARKAAEDAFAAVQGGEGRG